MATIAVIMAVAPLFYSQTRFSKANTHGNQIQAGGNLVPCAGKAGKTLCHGYALLNAPTHARLSCAKNQLTRL